MAGAAPGGALGRRWSPVTPRHFAWQAWHLVTSTFILHGRRGTWCHPPRLAFSSGPTLRVTSPNVQDRFRQLPPPPIARHGESASDERMPLERAGTANFAQLRPQRCGGAPMSRSRRHQRWPQARGHCLCPLLQRNLRLNSVARRRRDSRPREKKCFCNFL